MEWKFKKIEKGDTKQNPAYRELFRNDDLDTVVKPLVREDIQNRLDAHNRESVLPTRVRYFLPTEDKYLSRSASQVYLSGIEEHINTHDALEEIGCEYEQFNFECPMPFLVIECFNTTGLKGDPSETRDPDESEAERNDFYWFFRNVGRSKKKPGERGSWGLGKIVYHAASRIRSFLAYNVRTNDYQQTLFGRSVLAIHKLADNEYVPDGYYGVFLEDKYPSFATPTDDKEKIDQFKKDFSISRQMEQPGLSIVIPFPDPSLTYDGILKDVIEHYFWEIICGRLVVDVECGARKEQLTQESLQNAIMQLTCNDKERERVSQKIAFCEQIHRIYRTNGSLYKLSPPRAYTSPDIKNLFQTSELYEEARSRYQKNELVGFEVNVSIPFRNGNEEKGSFQLFLQRDSNLEKPDETFIRDGLTIIGEHYIHSNEKIHTLTLAEKDTSKTMSEFLGDSENPAHTLWCSTDDHFKEKYGRGGVSRLQYIRRFGVHLNSLLGRVEDARLEYLLEDMFYLNLDKEEPDVPRRKRRKPRNLPPLLPPRPKAFLIEKLSSPAGFYVQNNPEVENPPIRLTIKIAYEFEGEGNPFGKYHPADFNLADGKTKISVNLVGCKELSRAPNSITVQIYNPDYRIELRGFDSNRDLQIRVVEAGKLLEEGEQ